MTNRINATTLNQNSTYECDVVVVGSGAGGASVAWSLVEQGLDVIVIEEGSEFRAKDFSRRVWHSTRTMYRDAGATVTMGSPAIALPLGRTWGGTTTVNSGTCLRLPEYTSKKWQSESNFPFPLEQLTPYYDTVEKIQNVRPVDDAVMSTGNSLFRKGAEKLGYKGQALRRNEVDCKGTGLCAFGCPTGAKQSVNVTFLAQAEQKGLRGITGARVHDVLLKGNKAVGIVAHPLQSDLSTGVNNNISITVRAKKVVLSMGAIFTPHFMLRNRLGNNSGQVGKNLRIHPAGKLMGLFPENIDGWTGVPQSYWVDEFLEEGIVFEGAFVPPSALAFALPALGHKLKELMSQYNKIGGFGVMVSDETRGRIYSGPGGKPIIRYNLVRSDIEKFKKGIAIGAEVYLEAGADSVLTCAFGAPHIRSRADIDNFLQSRLKASDLELIAFHPVGTCRMGTDPRSDVVGPDGQSFDIENLHIADASLFPMSPSVNPQLTIMALCVQIGEAIAAQM